MISPCYLAPHIHNWSQKSVSESRLSSSSIRDFQWAHLHERGGGKRNPPTQIQCSCCRALLMSTDAEENTTLEKKQISNCKGNALKSGGQRRHLRHAGDSETRGHSSSGNGYRWGRVSPLVVPAPFFARPQGADPIFTGCQLVCFEKIGFNLLSFEATYLWGPSKTRFEPVCVG